MPEATTQKTISTSVDIDVPFYDADSYRLVWHGNYVKYFEVARCKLLEAINFTYADMEAAGFFFPVIDLRIKYIKPVLFTQKITVTASLSEWQHRLKINYLIHDQQTSERLTKGYTTQVAVAMPENEMLLISPDILIDKVKAAQQHA